MLKLNFCTFTFLITMISTPAFSDGFFEDWGLGVETYGTFNMASETGFGVIFASKYPERIQSFSVGMSFSDTGNTFQYEEAQMYSFAMSGVDEDTKFSYSLSLNSAEVDVFTSSTIGTYTFSSVVGRGELTIGSLPWADEAYLIVGGVFEKRFNYAGMLPYIREQSVFLGANITIQFVDIIGLNLLSFAIEAMEVHAPNQYSGVPLEDVCDVGFRSPRTYIIEGYKNLQKFKLSAHLSAGEDSCSDALVPGAGIKVTWVI